MGVLITSFPTPTLALTKNETVYAKIDESGNIKNIFANEHLINTQSDSPLEDYSELKNILNINGDEKFKISDNKITWNTAGKDIFYQGTTEKELPIKLNITYKLDNKKISYDISSRVLINSILFFNTKYFHYKLLQIYISA